MPSPRIKQSNDPTPTADTLKLSSPWFLIGVVAVYLLLAAAYNRLIPFENGAAAAAAIQERRLPVNPDEAAHVANAYVYKSGHIPVFQPGTPDFEAHQPPLYYGLIAPLLAPPASNTLQPASGARWLSIAVGAALIFFVWSAVREIFPERQSLADTAACICLLPTNVNVCASISNDVLTNAVVAAALWQLTRLVRLAAVPRQLALQSLLLGCLLAIGLYTKTSTLVLFPAVVVAGWLLVRQGMIPARDALLMMGISCGLGLVLASPWLARNTRLYGDPVAQHIFNAAFTGTTATMAHMLTLVAPSTYLAWVASWTFASFWAVFDGMRLFLPAGVYYLLAALAMTQLIGAVRWLRRERLSPAQTVSLASAGTVASATIFAFARFNTSFFQAQGRYLYPGLLFFGIVLAIGTLGWLKEQKTTKASVDRLLPYATATALLILNAVSLHALQSAFSASA